MKIPTVSRTQILGAKGASQVADPSVARREGTLWAQFGKVASNATAQVSNYFSAAKKEEANTAKYNATTEFTKWSQDFKRQLKDQKVEGKEYAKLYDKNFREWSGKYLSANSDYAKDIKDVLERNYANNLSTVDALGVKKHSKDLKFSADKAVANVSESVKAAPETFQTAMLNTRDKIEGQLGAGSITADDASAQLKYMGTTLATDAISGYARQGRWEEAISFIDKEGVGELLGTAQQDKLRAKILNRQALSENKFRNQQQYDRAEVTLREREKAEGEMEGLIHSLAHAKTAGGVQIINEKIEKISGVLGFANYNKAIKLTGVALEEMSDAAAYEVITTFGGAESDNDFLKIRRDILSRQGDGSLKSDRASALLLQLKSIKEADKADPSARFNTKSGLKTLSQYFKVSDIDNLLDFEGKNKSQALGAVARFWEMRGQGVDGITASHTILNEIKASQGGIAPVQSMTGKRFKTQEDITDAALYLFKAQKAGAISEPDAMRQWDGLGEASQFLKLESLIENTSPVPFPVKPKVEKAKGGTAEKTEAPKSWGGFK